MKPQINFITLAVTDLEKSVRFYRDGLGLRTKGLSQSNPEHCLFELENGFSLVLFRHKEFLDLTDNADKKEISAGFIISHIAESRSDVDQILKNALNAGAKQVGEIQNADWGYSANFIDLDGHQWEIVFMPNHA